ncbi:unnamed protein product [marine sediment metagenome]|uniref:Uncharacterized protein n=1 Tax=marine sediment metagenome TaxID=412755 RepID=X1EXB5_9ZZZZ
MEDNLEIISKNGGRLEVWVNIFNKTIRFNGEEVEMQPRGFSSPEYHSSGNQYEICLTYGMGRKPERKEDIKKLRDISTINVRNKEGWSEDLSTCFLYLHFPKNTRVAVANYE